MVPDRPLKDFQALTVNARLSAMLVFGLRKAVHNQYISMVERNRESKIVLNRSFPQPADGTRTETKGNNAFVIFFRHERKFIATVPPNGSLGTAVKIEVGTGAGLTLQAPRAQLFHTVAPRSGIFLRHHPSAASTKILTTVSKLIRNSRAVR